MDIKTFVDLVNNVGVPVAVIIGLGVGMFWMIKYNMKNTDKITDALYTSTEVAKESTDTNKELSETNRILVEQFNVKIDKLGDKLDILINK